MLFFHRGTRSGLTQVCVIPQYKGKWLLARNRSKRQQAFPEEQCRSGESPREAANRVLAEEWGVSSFSLWPVSVYAYLNGDVVLYGQLFFAHVEDLVQDLPFAKAEHCFLDESTDGLLYSGKQALFLEQANKWAQEQRTSLYCAQGPKPKVKNTITATGLLRSLEGHYIDHVYTFPNEDVKKALIPLVETRQLKLEVDEDLGRDIIPAFMIKGFPAFHGILMAERGSSALVIMHHDLFAAVLSKCGNPIDSVAHGGEKESVELDMKYLTPEERKEWERREKAKTKKRGFFGFGKREAAPQSVPLLQIDFLFDVLLHAQFI